MSASGIEHGLRELEAVGLATHGFHGWRPIDP
jgi:hypothetical protein